jgi:iron(III) transport system permease protein
VPTSKRRSRASGLQPVTTLVIAVPLAVIVIRTKTPGRNTISVLMQWPFFISPLIFGFGWITMYGPSGFVSVAARSLFGFIPWNLYSLPGMAIVEAVALAPIAYIFCANALRNSDASLEGAARTVDASPWRILFSVVLPMLRPPIVYSAVLIFTMAIETLSVPLIVGQPVGITVFSTFLYKNGIQSINPDYGILGAASVVILLATIVLVLIQGKLLKDAKRFGSVRGKATRPQLLDLGGLKWVRIVALSLYLICGALIPVVGLILRSSTRIFTPLQNPLTSLTFDNYSRVLDADGYRQSITNSLIVSGIGAILVAAIAVAAAVVAKRSTFRFSKTIEYLALGAPRYEAAAALEQAALAELRERRPDRAIETNVEFWAAVILDFAEVPTLMMPAISPAAAPRAGVPTSSSRNV